MESVNGLTAGSDRALASYSVTPSHRHERLRLVLLHRPNR